jgi:hypothetical protein
MTSKSYYDLVREAKTRVAEVTAMEGMRLRNEHHGTVIVDCREPNETALGTIAGSVVIPRGVLEQNIERVATRDRKVIIYCASGTARRCGGHVARDGPRMWLPWPADSARGLKPAATSKVSRRRLPYPPIQFVPHPPSNRIRCCRCWLPIFVLARASLNRTMGIRLAPP